MDVKLDVFFFFTEVIGIRMFFRGAEVFCVSSLHR